MDTVPAPTDTSTYEGRHRSAEPDGFAAGSALYGPRHATRPNHFDGCVCRLCTARPDIDAVLDRQHNTTEGAR